MVDFSPAVTATYKKALNRTSFNVNMLHGNTTSAVRTWTESVPLPLSDCPECATAYSLNTFLYLPNAPAAPPKRYRPPPIRPKGITSRGHAQCLETRYLEQEATEGTAVRN